MEKKKKNRKKEIITCGIYKTLLFIPIPTNSNNNTMQSSLFITCELLATFQLLIYLKIHIIF